MDEFPIARPLIALLLGLTILFLAYGRSTVENTPVLEDTPVAAAPAVS